MAWLRDVQGELDTQGCRVTHSLIWLSAPGV